jgi:hypothetical protein
LSATGWQRLWYGGALAPSLLNPLPPYLTVPSVLFHYLDLSICDMSNPESSGSFRFLFETALQRYEEKTGTKLIEHPLAKQLEKCDSVDSITIVLQEQARCFGKFKGDDGKIMKSLKYSVNVLYALSTNTALGEGIGLVRLKALIIEIVDS